jgi:hypothetical protein
VLIDNSRWRGMEPGEPGRRAIGGQRDGVEPERIESAALASVVIQDCQEVGLCDVHE